MKNMNKKYKKAFTLVELLVVIAILAVLASASVIGYLGFIKKAKVSNDENLLTQLNLVLQAGEVVGETKTTRDVYNLLEENGISKDDIVAKQDGHEFVYNKSTNRFECLEEDWEAPIYEEAKTKYSVIDDYRTSFGATVDGMKIAGYQTYTGSTTFTYKYLTSDNKVIVGDTVTEDNTLTYFLHVPENYDSRISYPIITYIHGSGGCNYLQYSGYGGLRQISSSELQNTTYALEWLLGSNDQNVWTKFYQDEDLSINQGGNDGAFGYSDTPFTKAWFNWIKTHPEDDAFYIFVQLNDETYWENLAEYTYIKDNVEYTNLKQLSISNCYKASNESNNNMYGTLYSNYGYNQTYNSSEIGCNVWLQLLTQTIDSLAEEYNIDLNRQHIIGQSLGGITTCELLAHYLNRFATAFPGATPTADITTENVARIVAGGTKIVAYHGKNDWVSMGPIEKLCNAIKNAGGDASLVKVDGQGHTSQYFATYFDDIMDVMRATSR